MQLSVDATGRQILSDYREELKTIRRVCKWMDKKIPLYSPAPEVCKPKPGNLLAARVWKVFLLQVGGKTR